MLTLFTVLGFGFLLGLRHATDADHVVAVTTLLGKHGKIRHSAFIGILWGIGHSITVTLVGIPIIFFALTIPPRISTLFEFFVGLMLVLLGILTLSGLTEKISKHFTKPIIHKHAHESKGEKHSHLHIHASNYLSQSFHHIGIFQLLRPVGVGLVHGLAGSAAVAILILSTIKNPYLSAFYLLIFHFGVIIGMMIITTFLGASVVLIKRKSENLHSYLITSSGILSLGFGVYIIYKTGISFFN
jgi:high-affinity nickel permease